MSINCIIIDDEPLAIKVIEQYISNVSILNLKGTFENPMEAQELLNSNDIDLIFLDIQMPLITGIDFLKTIKINSKVIFTTAHRNYAIESYELDAVDYLLKPISFPRFLKAINKYEEISLDKNYKLESRSDDNFIYVNSNKKNIKIDFDSVLYIDSIKDYIRIHTSEKTIVTKEKISSFIDKLSEDFIRVHRSYIVNKNKVTAYTAKDIEIEDIEIPIGNYYKDEIRKLGK